MTSGPAPTGAPPPETGQPYPPTPDDALDVGPLFDTPQITATDAGHWHQGREYVAVDVDGELDYQPAATPPTIDTAEESK